jgi:hypothetical protein
MPASSNGFTVRVSQFLVIIPADAVGEAFQEGNLFLLVFAA